MSRQNFFADAEFLAFENKLCQKYLKLSGKTADEVLNLRE
jgi:hypothetical protein